MKLKTKFFEFSTGKRRHKFNKEDRRKGKGTRDFNAVLKQISELDAVKTQMVMNELDKIQIVKDQAMDEAEYFQQMSNGSIEDRLIEAIALPILTGQQTPQNSLPTDSFGAAAAPSPPAASGEDPNITFKLSEVLALANMFNIPEQRVKGFLKAKGKI